MLVEPLPATPTLVGDRQGRVVPFVDALHRFGERPAVMTSTRVISYAELSGRITETARRLGTTRRLVLVEVRNDLGSLVAYLGALAGGHAVLLASAEADHADNLIRAYDPDAVLSGGQDEWALEERRDGSRHEMHPELALLLSTSGSTGSPKLVRLSHDNLQANVESIAEYLDIRATDRAATTLPMHYCYGLSVIHSHLLRGAAFILTGRSVVDACFWDLFKEHEGTSFAGVPYTFDLLDRVGFATMRLPHLRYITQAGGRLEPEAVSRYAELGRREGWDFVVMYGQTEATARMAYLPPNLAVQHPNAIGIPIPGGSFILEPVPEHEELGDLTGSEIGELVYAGPNVMLGYAERPADLELGRTVDVLHTGDLARRNSQGLYEIVGRRSRFAKILGLRIDPERIEAGLARHGVTAACDASDNGLAIAFEGGRDPDYVRQLAGEAAGLPLRAIRAHAVARLPRLASGKPDYGAIRKLPAAEGAFDGTGRSPSVPVGNPTAEALRDLYAELLGRADVTDESSFVSLGGDSLSYVEMSVRLEQLLGQLPVGWHTTPIRDLVRAPRRRRTWLRVVEMSVVLRALAIFFIVGTHAGLFSILGSAHVLMAVAGFNFARFQLTAGERIDRVRRQARSIARVAAPSMAWIAAAFVLTDKYSLPNVFLLNALVGPERWTTEWHFWFIEVLVYVLVGLALLLAVPRIDRWERRFPYGFAMVLVAVGVVGRFEVVDLGVPHTKPVLWLFALGWATARASRVWQRVGVSALIALTVPGFFGDPWRDGLIVLGMALLVWVPSVPIPVGLTRVAGVLASSSLYIYLTHWQVYPLLDDHHPLLAVFASLVVGILYWQLATAVMSKRRSRSRQSDSLAGGPTPVR